jgi:rRNA maturation RNase YbeY
LTFKGKRQLQGFIEGIIVKEGFYMGVVNYIFCSDDFLLDINQRFLQHDYFTDIITFGLSDIGSPKIDGEIYISLDRVEDNARILLQDYKKELLRVIFHGVLHLCGFRDKTKSEKQLMRNKEDEYLRLYLK